MSEFAIAAAQTCAVRGDIQANLENHVRVARLAIRQKVHVLMFPELSITGYEPELAAQLALTHEDERLRPLKEFAQQHQVTLIAGAPLKNGLAKPFIGAIIFNPGQTNIYRKRYLHPGEEAFFSPGDRDCAVDIKGQRIGIAICADIANPAHPAAVAALGASIYAAGVLITEKGFEVDADLLRNYAITHSMAVIMANHGAPSGGYSTAGRSCAWDPAGNLLAAVPGPGEALIVATLAQSGWSATSLLARDFQPI